MHDLLGPGIFNSDGDLWKLQRKTASNIFSVKNFKDFVTRVFSSDMESFDVRLDQLSQSNVVVDLQDLFYKFTLDSFLQIGFNVKLNSILQEKSVPFATAFDRTQNGLNFRFFSPIWKIFEYFHGQMTKDKKVYI